jgi:hypothetical protein
MLGRLGSHTDMHNVMKNDWWIDEKILLLSSQHWIQMAHQKLSLLLCEI